MTPQQAHHVAVESDPLLAAGQLEKEPRDEDDTTPLSESMDRLDSFVQAGETVIENMRDFAENTVEKTQEITATITEDVADEVFEVKEAALEELHDADEGELTILDMALTRNLSILPGELQNAVDMLQRRQDDKEEKQNGDVELQPIMQSTKEESDNSSPLSAYVGLASAVISLSSIGPLLEFQTETTPSMKINWRMIGTAMLLTPLALLDLKRRGGIPRLTLAQWVTFLLSTVSYIAMCIGFAIALDYTSVGNAVILANSQAIMLLLGNLLVGAPVTMLEGTGAVVAFAGAILCSKDSSDGATMTAADKDSSLSSLSTLYGDGLALLAGLGGCGYLIFAKTSRSHMGLFVFTWLTMLSGSVLTYFLQVLVLRESVTLDMNRNTGLFGFMYPEFDRLPLEFIIVVVCNLLGTMGYVRAMQFFDSLVISVAGLMEPVVAEFIGFAIGVSVLPGMTGWIGNLLVTLGTLAVVYRTPSQKGKDEMTAH